MAGVLVFVEQDHPVAGPKQGTDLRESGRQSRCGGHLGTEIDDFFRPHAGVELLQ